MNSSKTSTKICSEGFYIIAEWLWSATVQEEGGKTYDLKMIHYSVEEPWTLISSVVKEFEKRGRSVLKINYIQFRGISNAWRERGGKRMTSSAGITKEEKKCLYAEYPYDIGQDASMIEVNRALSHHRDMMELITGGESS